MAASLKGGMTIEALRDRCTYWQKVLRLQDWDVKVSLVRQWDVPNSFGTCEPYLEKRIAKVKILDVVDDGDPDNFEDFDQERTLVHELLHIHFETFSAKPDTSKAVAQHQTIQVLSSALVKLDRARYRETDVIEKPELQAVDMLVAATNGAR
jgi:hypothetical protein